MLFSIHQIEVHRSLPVKKLGAALVGEDHDAINHQIGRATTGYMKGDYLANS